MRSGDETAAHDPDSDLIRRHDLPPPAGNPPTASDTAPICRSADLPTVADKWPVLTGTLVYLDPLSGRTRSTATPRAANQATTLRSAPSAWPATAQADHRR
jgi:hypothetical protein